LYRPREVSPENAHRISVPPMLENVDSAPIISCELPQSSLTLSISAPILRTMSCINLTPSDKSRTREDIGGCPFASSFVLSLQGIHMLSRERDDDLGHSTICRKSVLGRLSTVFPTSPSVNRRALAVCLFLSRRTRPRSMGRLGRGVASKLRNTRKGRWQITWSTNILCQKYKLGLKPRQREE
jgi:hypothetical protein